MSLGCTPKALQASADALNCKAALLSVNKRLPHTSSLRNTPLRSDGFELPLAGMGGGEGDAGMVVDGHKQRLSEYAIDHRVAPVAVTRWQGLTRRSNFLMSVCRMSKCLVLVASHRLGRLQAAEARQAS